MAASVVSSLRPSQPRRCATPEGGVCGRPPWGRFPGPALARSGREVLYVLCSGARAAALQPLSECVVLLSCVPKAALERAQEGLLPTTSTVTNTIRATASQVGSSVGRARALRCGPGTNRPSETEGTGPPAGHGCTSEDPTRPRGLGPSDVSQSTSGAGRLEHASRQP